MPDITNSPPTITADPQSARQPGGRINWAFALIPLLLLGLTLSYLVVTEGGLGKLAGPPVEKLRVQRITLPQPGLMIAEVINDGPQDVTVAQVLVDDAFWRFSAAPSTTIPRFGTTLFSIPYPWVREEAHMIVFLTSIGSTFEAPVPVAVETPQLSADLLLRFALVGLYVGIVPVALGLLWYPFMRRLGRRSLNFILALTVGLLLYLAVGTWLDAVEFAAQVPTFWQGIPLALFVSLLTLAAITLLGNRKSGQPESDSRLGTAYRIALGIGLHNLGEGLAIGAAFASGQAALGTLLILGFTLHNITEGVGIAAPVLRESPGLRHFILLCLLAGGPAIFGTMLGSFAFNPVLATIFMGIGLGAILQVVFEVSRMIMRDNARHAEPVMNLVTVGGVSAGVLIMYVTAFLVKF